MKHTVTFSALPTLLALACGSTPAGPSLGSVTQAIRAGVSEGGEVFLGADLLVTEGGGVALPCDETAVQFEVSVSRTGADGNFVPVENAQVYRACSSASQGRVALVMDNSRSLDGQLPLLQQAASRVSQEVLNNGGRMSLTRVSTNSAVLSELSSDPGQIDAAVDSMFIANGWTSLYDGVRLGNQTLGKTGEVTSETFTGSEEFCHLGSKQSVVVFTDSGENNSSHQMHWSEDYPGDGLDSTLSDLQQLQVGGSTTPIYTVGLGEDADNDALQALSEATGGKHVAVDSPNDVEDVLAMLAEYGSNTHRVCTKLPDHICGSIDVKIEHRFTDGEDIVEGSTVQHIDLPCPERAMGRLATILLALDAADMGEDNVLRLMAQSVNWVSPVDNPKVLFVRDDFHHGELSDSSRQLHELLAAAGYETDFIDEPRRGVSLGQLQGYDVVWFSNPGYPIDDLKSYNSLLKFSQFGGGVVMQGDDMSQSHAASFSTSALTNLVPVDNGTQYCGKNINNRGGNSYHVQFTDSTHPLLAGLSGSSFAYADDIDTTVLLPLAEGATAEVLAWASDSDDPTCPAKPVIVAHTPSEDSLSPAAGNPAGGRK